jgi:hypothetical protein
MRTEVDTKKTKENNQQKSGKDPMQRGLTATINDNKEDRRQKSCHLPQIN